VSVPTRPFGALRLIQTGTGVRMDLREIRWDELDPGPIGIRVHYSSVNYKDALAATGSGKILRRPEVIGGLDLAGEVIVSEDPNFPCGSLVVAVGGGLGESRDGGFSEYARVPADLLVRLDPGLGTYAAMQIGTAGFTALLALRRLQAQGIRPEDGPVVVSGATGGVGSFAINLLDGMGYAVSALTHKSGCEAYLRAIGAREILGPKDWSPTGPPLLSGRWAGGIDNVGGAALSWMIRSARRGGAIASVGMAASPELQMTVFPFILRGVSLIGINSTEVEDGVRRALWHDLAHRARPEAIDRIAPQQIPLAALPASFEDWIANRVVGRVVVAIAKE